MNETKTFIDGSNDGSIVFQQGEGFYRQSSDGDTRELLVHEVEALRASGMIRDAVAKDTAEREQIRRDRAQLVADLRAGKVSAAEALANLLEDGRLV